MRRFFLNGFGFVLFAVAATHCSGDFGHSSPAAFMSAPSTDAVQSVGTYYIEFLSGKTCLTDPNSYRDNTSGGDNTWGGDMLNLRCPYPTSNLPSWNREYQIDTGRDQHRLIQSVTNSWCAGVTDGIGRVVHWNCSRSDDIDLWDIVPADQGRFKIRNVAEGKCMYPYKGEKVRVGNCERPDTLVSFRRGRLANPPYPGS